MTRLLLAASLCCVLADAALAQHRSLPAPSRPPAEPVAAPVETPAATPEPAPRRAARPRPAATPAAQPAASGPTITVQASPSAAPAAAPQRAAAPPPQASRQPAPPRTVACGGGVFAKDSSHLKLAQFFGSENLTWTQVAGPEGSKLNASVLYPKDPKRRLEVLWNNEGARSDTQLIVINEQSMWAGPKGLKLGMPMAAVEKLNGKPFKLSGFGGESGGTVVSWDGGGLAELPGGCKVSIRFGPDKKAPQAALDEVSGKKELLSSLPAYKQAAPKIEEIMFGY